MADVWENLAPAMRRKHFGAALRRVMKDCVLPEYRAEAANMERSKTYRKKYKPTRRVSKKTGKTTDSRRRVIGNLRRSVGSTRMYPGYPRADAVDMKGGYRMGKLGGGAAMLLDEGTKDRFRKGSFTRFKAFKEEVKLSTDLLIGKRRYFKKSAKRINYENSYMYLNGLKTSAKARKGFTGKIKPRDIQRKIFGRIKGVTEKKLLDEMKKAYEKALKELESEKAQAIYNKYAQKYGRAGFTSPAAGYFGKRLPRR
jgi:hypothetical protein